jgi:hypothetical protein
MNDFHPDADWHDPAPNRALIVAACISGCAVMIGLIALWRWL